MVCEKKQNVLSLCKLSTGTCFTPKTTEASEMSSFIMAPALEYDCKNVMTQVNKLGCRFSKNKFMTVPGSDRLFGWKVGQ